MNRMNMSQLEELIDSWYDMDTDELIKLRQLAGKNASVPNGVSGRMYIWNQMNKLLSDLIEYKNRNWWKDA